MLKPLVAFEEESTGMTTQMLHVGHNVYITPDDAPHHYLTLDDIHTEHASRTTQRQVAPRRTPQVTPSERLLIRLLIEVCMYRGAAQAEFDQQDDHAEFVDQVVPQIRQLADSNQTVQVTQELKAFFDAAYAILSACRFELGNALSDAQRQLLIDLLGQTASAYWWSCERQGLSGLFSQLPIGRIGDMLDLAEQYVTLILSQYPAPGRSLRYDDPSAVHMVQVPAALR